MRVRVLGCDGGIGNPLRTNAFLVDDDVLLDAGTGLGELPLAELARIDHVFVTHAHIDHIASLPLLLDAVLSSRTSPVTVHGTDETVRILQTHIFNWSVWPDFGAIPSPEKPGMQYSRIEIGQTVDLGGRRITPVPAAHAVPTVGFHLRNGNGSLVYCGDTTTCDPLWEAVNAIDDLKFLVIETAFDDAHMRLAEPAGHLCPTLLAAELEKLRRPAEIYIDHMKPGLSDSIMAEIGQAVPNRSPHELKRGQVLEI